MVLKMAAPPKPFPTNFARKGLFSSVNVLVADQVVSPAEFLSTDLTPGQHFGENMICMCYTAPDVSLGGFWYCLG